MPDYLRPRRPGAKVFFTVALARRGDDLLVREVGRLRWAVAEEMKRRPFGIDAWVVLPDHIHAVWTLPEGDAAYGVRWGAIKGRFTRAVREAGYKPAPRSRSKVAKEDGGVWQRRFWEHHIRDETDWVNHVRYCWGNPVKHGLVERPAEWPYSSIHRDIARGMVEPEWSGIVDDAVGWGCTRPS